MPLGKPTYIKHVYIG